ncbi:MAG: hypothetical protein HP498_05885 [Nitrospira sp.]|nr:hypothetical protein [Nitrospira sp.]
MVSPPGASAIEAVPVFFPLRPFNFDVSFNQRTFAPQARVLAVQAGFTALRYGSLEVRTVYQYYSHHTQTFRVLAVQAGFTALRYGSLEVRTVYQYYSHHTQTFTTDQHSLYLNPRWNNFIDVLDFPRHKPINRIIRHLLFGPLEDRAVPYVGALLGGTLPGRDDLSPGYLYGGQVGVRFPVAQGVSVDMGFQYSRFEIDFKSKSDLTDQWLFTIGIRL